MNTYLESNFGTWFYGAVAKDTYLMTLLWCVKCTVLHCKLTIFQEFGFIDIRRQNLVRQLTRM